MMLTGGFGYDALPVLGIFTMLAAAAVALCSYVAEQRSGLTPPERAAAADTLRDEGAQRVVTGLARRQSPSRTVREGLSSFRGEVLRPRGCWASCR